ncbi:ECF-type sigma factor [Nocardia sp. IBHARD005]|uniref:ECF-type sigma factor n=1 Tax=Nocardia sp. IBHARD005 TaxID=3457765 RepID=UPI004058EAB4
MLAGQTNTKAAPAGAGNTDRGLAPNHASPRKGGDPMLSVLGDTSHDQAQTHLVAMLDEVRRQQELLNVNRARYLALARQYGMTNAEIGEVVGMSASGVKKAIGRAAGTPGIEFGECA